MSESRWRYQLAILLAFVSLLLTACFRDASEVIEQQPVARQAATATDLPAEEPTELPPTATPEPTIQEQPADDFALSATALIALQTQPANVTEPLQSTAEAGQPAAIPVARATIPPGEDCVHEIRFGDTLFQLSLAYGVSVDEMALASEIENPDVIAVGQKITIPGCGTTGFIPPPTSVPTATLDPDLLPPTVDPAELEIASVAPDAVNPLVEQAQAALLDNAQSEAAVAFAIQSAELPAPNQTYTMQENDTLFLVAARFGTSVDILAALNDITDIDNVATGTVLQIP